jgi:hypothetical protein
MSVTMQPTTQVLRAKAGVRALCVAIYLAGVVLLMVHLPFDIPDRHKGWIVPCFAILGACWLADVFLTRIVLASDSLRIVSISDFQSRTVPRAEIERVTWAAGCGAALTLRDGKGVRLPSAGRNAQGLANTIRAWLKRTEVPL